MAVQPRKPQRQSDDWSDFFSFLWMWAAFASGALVLSWFISVVNNVTQRGEQRALQQRADGALVVVEEREAAGRHRLLTSADPKATALQVPVAAAGP